MLSIDTVSTLLAADCWFL